MASIITATTTSGLTQSADNSGVLQLASGTGNLVTVPSATGTMALTTSGTPVADYWYLNTPFSVVSGTNTDLTTNLSQLNFSGTGVIGSMTQSSGVFTFPQTGLYRVSFSAQFYDPTQASRYLLSYIYVSTNGGSSFTSVVYGQGSIAAIVSSANTFAQVPTEIQINVNNTSNIKVKFQVLTQQACNVNGNGSASPTFMTFTRLGNSV